MILSPLAMSLPDLLRSLEQGLLLLLYLMGGCYYIMNHLLDVLHALNYLLLNSLCKVCKSTFLFARFYLSFFFLNLLLLLKPIIRYDLPIDEVSMLTLMLPLLSLLFFKLHLSDDFAD
jgi:hypothetical protein